jgi:NAD(P)-dependent dehydrogenase (short-subunit alcohol dehydrogenase family)
MVTDTRPAALVTGGSRGIGAATALAFARRGYDVAITFRNKVARAEAVARDVEAQGVRAITIAGDLTDADDVRRLGMRVAEWTDSLDVLVLNASGGLERGKKDADPTYAGRINHDAQLSVLDTMLPLFTNGGTVVFVTSHWAHLYGEVAQLPTYAPVAETKWAGEQALRARQHELSASGIRTIVVTGDLVEGTITPKLLERAGPGLTQDRIAMLGSLPSTRDMGQAIAAAAVDTTLPAGHTIVVGGSLDTLHRGGARPHGRSTH